MKPFGRWMLAFVLAASALAAQAQTKVHWYGHAALRIETPTGGVILVDPWLGAKPGETRDF